MCELHTLHTNRRPRLHGKRTTGNADAEAPMFNFPANTAPFSSLAPVNMSNGSSDLTGAGRVDHEGVGTVAAILDWYVARSASGISKGVYR